MNNLREETQISVPGDVGYQDQSTAILEAQRKTLATELGKVGAFFGSKEQASMYLSAIVVVLILFFLGGFAIFTDDDELRSYIIKGLVPVLTAIAGFYFGKS